MAVDTYALCSLANFKTYAGIDGTDDDSRIELLIDAASDRIEKYCNRQFLTRTYTETYDGTGHTRLRLYQAPVTVVTRVVSGREEALNVTGTATGGYAAYVTADSTNLTFLVKIASGDSTDTLAIADYATLSSMNTAINALSNWTSTLRHGDGNWATSDIIASGALQCLDPDTASLYTWNEAEQEYDIDWTAGELIHAGAGWPRGSRNIYVEYTAGYTNVPDDVEQACMEMVKLAYDSAERDTSVSSERIGSYAWARGAVQEQEFTQKMADRLWSHRRIFM